MDLGPRLRDRLLTDVGGFFCNTRRTGQEICRVCTGPATGSMCERCHGHRTRFGDRIAELVVPLAYAQGHMPSQHQSAHHVLAYKRRPPVARCAKHLALMRLAAGRLHGACVARAAGSPWDAVTFVPSVDRPGREHPVAELARQLVDPDRLVPRIQLDLGTGAVKLTRIPREDGFVVPSGSVRRVAGRHVLVVDDTWVSGAKAQSAALALTAAGAATVTVLCVARWLRHDWPDHRALIESLTEPYDAYTCPVTGGLCPR